VQENRVRKNCLRFGELDRFLPVAARVHRIERQRGKREHYGHQVHHDELLLAKVYVSLS